MGRILRLTGLNKLGVLIMWIIFEDRTRDILHFCKGTEESCGRNYAKFLYIFKKKYNNYRRIGIIYLSSITEFKCNSYVNSVRIILVRKIKSNGIYTVFPESVWVKLTFFFLPNFSFWPVVPILPKL